jgi:hypothetical protein
VRRLIDEVKRIKRFHKADVLKRVVVNGLAGGTKKKEGKNAFQNAGNLVAAEGEFGIESELVADVV